MANSSYTGHNKMKTKLAKKSETSPVFAKKSYKENLEKSTNSSHQSKIQKRACDSTVNDLDFKSDKRKLFSCDFEGCNKKYTKLSHLKVRILDQSWIAHFSCKKSKKETFFPHFNPYCEMNTWTDILAPGSHEDAHGGEALHLPLGRLRLQVLQIWRAHATQAETPRTETFHL